MKKMITLGLVLILVFSLVACKQQTAETPNNETPQENPQNLVVDTDPKEELVEVTVYYMNHEYIETGDESLEKAIPVKKEVDISNKSIAEAVVEELQKVPEDEKLVTSLQNIKIISVLISGNTASVNLSSDNLNGGSLEETSILTQLILTLTELPKIEQVQIYVDGKERETLMSHYEIMEPLTREDIGY